MKQMVMGSTRLDPPRMLDPILTDLGSFYQTPEILPPLTADPGSGGKASDHLIPIMRPINELNNRCSRVYTEVKIRPVTKSGIDNLRNWFECQDWAQNMAEASIDQKAELLHSMIMGAINLYLPEKSIKVASDDSPWYNQGLKKLDRRRRREYHKNRRSDKYFQLCRLYEAKKSKAKKSYKKNMLDDIKQAKPGEWYSKLKRITRFDQGKSELLQVDEISHLDDQEQAERIADNQAAISNLYKEVQISDIQIPPFVSEDIPQFNSSQVRELILQLKPKKSTPPGDIPVKLVREFANFICIPLSDIINSSLRSGH